ncbi:MAG: glycosyltransferase family 2 protein [Gammaproteobacteria bacterium]
MPVDLSVIITCLNAEATFAGQLEALCRQQWDRRWEIVVADNGSTDDTLRIIRRYRRRLPQLRVVDASARRGCAAARNIGMQAARADCFAFCDVDDEIGHGWVAAMGEALLRHEFVACRVDDRRLNPPWVQALWPANPERQEGVDICLGFLPSAPGCGFGLTRRLFERVGDFDETLPRLDDFDYSWRAQLAGARVHLVPDAVIYYRHRHSLRGTFRLCVADGYSEVMLLRKFARQGMPWRPVRQALHDWVFTPLGLLRVRDRVSWGAWLKGVGVLAGRAHGSLEQRILAL